MKVPPRATMAKWQDMDHYVAELQHFWLTSLSNLDWGGRLALLEKIDEEILAGCQIESAAKKVSQRFTARIIESLRFNEVSCKEQAFIYLNSEVEVHRDAALAWMILHHQESPLMVTQSVLSSGMEKRASLRHIVNLPSVIAANDSRFTGHVVDISAIGAKLKTLCTLEKGAVIQIDVPFLGQITASVVWVAASYVGLTFFGQPLPGLSM